MNACELQPTLAFRWMGGAIPNHVLMQIRHKLPPRAIAGDWVTVSFPPEINFPTNHFGCIIFSFWGAGIPGLALMSRGARQCSQKARLVLSLRHPPTAPLRPGLMPREDLFHLASLWVCLLETEVSSGVRVARSRLDLYLSFIRSLRAISHLNLQYFVNIHQALEIFAFPFFSQLRLRVSLVKLSAFVK